MYETMLLSETKAGSFHSWTDARSVQESGLKRYSALGA